MQHRTLGKTGLDVSILGFGCAPAAYLKADQPRAAAMIAKLLDQGINLLDTAISYPGSHEFLGKYLSKRRKDYVLVSKCGGKVPGINGDAWTEPLITQSIDQALADMKIEQIDVMLLHTCDLATLKKGEAIDALVKARTAGKIRFAGYSGDNEAAVYAANHPEIAVIETSINIVEINNIDMVLPECVKNNIGVIAKRPIANACWKDTSQQEGIYKNYVANYTARLAKMGLTPAQAGFDEDSQSAWPRLALRFTLQQTGVTTAIVGTTNPENAANNFRYASEGQLTIAASERIRSAFKAADPKAQWPGLT